MGLFKRNCNHKWERLERSNALVLDNMGYPLRLFLVRCKKCGKIDQHWIDVDEREADGLETGESFLLEWSEV